MKLSVCMIVKNEEKTIKRCLGCVKKFADEIIVVDTGSTDNTKEIAKSFTDKIYDFEWDDNFSNARNFSFSKASYNYLMWIDADDYISDENIQKILNLKAEKDYFDVYFFKYAILFDEKNQPTFSYFRERILKKGFVWEGFIHESISVSGKIKYCDIDIEHRKENFTNPKRNLKIYQKHIKNGEILSERDQYYFSKEYFYNNYISSAIKNLKKYLKMKNKFLPNVQDSYLTLAKCYEIKGNLIKGKRVLLDFLENYATTAEIVCKLAEICEKIGKIYSAIYFYKSALEIEPDLKSGGFLDLKYYYFIPLIELCRILYPIDYLQSKKYHKILEQNYPDNEKVKFNAQFFKN